MAPFPFPKEIEPKLDLVRAYWESLKRADNPMPFWDDVKPSSLPDVAGALLLIDVFEEPARYRFRLVGRDLMDWYGKQISNNFMDEIEPRNPFEYLRSQCSATVEGRAPTYYRHVSAAPPQGRAAHDYARIVLPLWGEGRISMLLGAIVGAEAGNPPRP
jgi:PAS domain